MKLNDRLLAWLDRPPPISKMLAQWSERGMGLFLHTEAGPASGRLTALAETVLSRKGDVSGAIIAEIFLELWHAADREARDAFMLDMLHKFGADPSHLSDAATDYLAKPCAGTARQLHIASEPRRQEFLRRINSGKGGTGTLIAMREHLLGMLSSAPDLAEVDADFQHLFNSWFNQGFLTLRSIGWQTPANILEMLIRYEAVHEIEGWDDLRRRLAPEDRRCFGFFHPQMPDEPLIFVEVALTDRIPTTISQLLDSDRETIRAHKARTAVFYSISNCHRGLAGIALGNSLIKKVVQNLQAELKALDTFVTLSPMPGFARWVRDGKNDDAQLSAERRCIAEWVENPDWIEAGPDKYTELSELMLRAAAYYLLEAKRPDGKPLDPVARFHLGNGAHVERLDFLADRSQRGLGQSFGMMVNYLYEPGDIERNHERYVETGRIESTPRVKRLIRRNRTEMAQ